MVATPATESASIRARLSHPVIDADGHTMEFMPIVLDYIKDIGGTRAVEGFNQAMTRYGRWFEMSPEERRDTWTWIPPAGNGTPPLSPLDQATAFSPKLLHQRMDEIGLDFTIIYPSQGLLTISTPGMHDDETRQVACRAFNTYSADLYREYSDRMTPVATIPMHTPQEAIEELEYSVNVLGFKAIVIAGHVRRPVPKVAREYPELARSGVADRLDTFGLDSDYDYDPFWAKCVELKVAPTQHNASIGIGSHQSISNYVYNHLGHFATSGQALCKALLLGGVTRRFPTLRFGFLEAGVGWACNLYADLVGHWEKLSLQAWEKARKAEHDPELMVRLIGEYGEPKVKARLDEVRQMVAGRQRMEPLADEFAFCAVERAEELADLFVPNFYFGCEADDPITAWAFNSKVNPFGARLGAMMGSDIGHWDVPDMRHVLSEAFELVDKDLITLEDFRDFVFTNPVKLHAGMNPDFFKGTRCEEAVQQALSNGL